MVTDASAGTTQEAHNMSIQRMIRAGAIPGKLLFNMAALTA
ncbi:hypothetical protein P9579_29535 [Brevibacillus choshinensis]|nr:hypothetical protein [Brevibacillus choshinensis]